MKIPATLLLVSALIGGAVAYFCYQSRWQYALSHSPSLVLYSLNPHARGRLIPNLVVDKVLISDPADKQQLLDATNQAVTVYGPSNEAACFNPRHAVSTPDGQTFLAICFECGSAEIRTNGHMTVVPTNEQAQPLFEQLVHKYHLKTID